MPPNTPRPARALVPIVEPSADRTGLDHPRLQDPGPKDPASSYIARLAPSSRKTQRFAIQKIARVLGGSDPRTFPWHQLTYRHTRAFLLRMESELSSASGEPLAFTTTNRHIAALRGVLQEAWRMGLMTADQYMAARDPLKPIRGHRLPKGRLILQTELDDFLRVCSEDKTPFGVRDLALFTLLCFGLRRHEVVTVRLADYNSAERVLSVVGKGNKEREVALSRNGCVFLDAWVKERPSPANGCVTLMTYGHRCETLTPQAVGAMLAKRAKEAGVDEKSLSSHDFRRTFISSLLDAGVDIVTVQKLVGHSDTSTTAGYDRRGRAVAAAAAEKVGWGTTKRSST